MEVPSEWLLNNSKHVPKISKCIKVLDFFNIKVKNTIPYRLCSKRFEKENLCTNKDLQNSRSLDNPKEAEK